MGHHSLTSKNFAKAGLAWHVDLMASLADFQLFIKAVYASTTDCLANWKEKEIKLES